METRKMPYNESTLEQVYNLPLEFDNPFGNDILADYQYLIAECTKYIPSTDLGLITKAFYFCVDSHKNIIRKSGFPYYTHPLKVSLSLLRYFSIKDDFAVVAALLHDTIEDVDWVTNELISELFGSQVAMIVDSLTKIKGTSTIELDKAQTYGKLFMTLVKDIRALYIKLADRLDNMKTLYHLKEERQIAIAYETLNFYTPFSQRLGLTKIRKDFEDLSLYFIDKEAFNIIRTSLKTKGIDFIIYVQDFFDRITDKLNKFNINHVLTIEHKHIYEIYRMIEQGKNLEDIDNFYAIVITLDTSDYSECYRVYGIVANMFGPVSSLDDYIARPKVNLYRALHSTHMGPGRKLIEVVIRTKEMDKIAVDGISSLYSLQEQHKTLHLNEEDLASWVKWMQDIIHEGDDDAIQKIWGSIKTNIYDDHISIFTKSGEIFRIPKGSCPIDLAFEISDDIAYHCISVKINGEIKNLDYELNDNDTIELLTSPNSKPMREWEDSVITQKAIVRLHEYFKNEKVKIRNNYKHQIRKEIKLRISGDDRAGMLHEITGKIGKVNIQRINISTTNSLFEGIFTITVDDSDFLNHLFSRILSIKGLRSIEKIEDTHE